MSQSRRYDLLATALVLSLLLGLSFTPVKQRLDGFSVDLMLALRHLAFGQRHPAATSPTVVVALDEQTYRTPPFANLPHVLWTPQLAQVQDAILAGGAKVLGYDLILPTSLESHLPGYEKPFLRSLMLAARQGKLVLGKVQHSEKPVAPHPAQSMVVKHQQNIRALNMHSDVDDVVRRIPLFFQNQNGGQEPAMSLELAARGLGVVPAQTEQGIALGEYLIPGSADNAALINFQGGADIPTYSLADLYACAEQGKSDYFQQHFAGKLVLLGTVLDVEDRKLTSKRLMTEAGAGAEVAPCLLAKPEAAASYRRDSIPGVYILASAVNDFIRQDFLRQTQANQDRALLLAAVLLVALLSILLKPAWSALAVAALGLGWLALSLLLLQHLGYLLPAVWVLTGIVISYALMLLYRYMIADQQKNQL
ncbi:MAG: CHASE2 domain-containing protein, partial [Gammaproteobacteria bacterium]|nr:CHASE2 domain-containing protein [Gammaproteobacteria bacterium]